MIYYVKYDPFYKDYSIFNGKTNKRLSLKRSFTLIKRFYLRCLDSSVANSVRITDKSLVWNFYRFLLNVAIRFENYYLHDDIYCEKISFNLDTMKVQAFFVSSQRVVNDLPF